MNVLLHTPPAPKQSISMDYLMQCEPLELEYLYTVLCNEHTVFFSEKETKRSVKKKIEKHKIDIICISSYINHTPYILALSEELKLKFPHLFIVIGGVYPEVVPEHFFSRNIDAVVFENHLNAVSEICNHISNPEKLKEIAGVAFSQFEYQIQKNGKSQNFLPIPNRILFNSNPKKYNYLYFEKCASLKTAFGCPGKCKFCYCRLMNDGHYSVRKISDVVEEIEQIKSENIFILDDNFLTNKKRLEEFCEILENKNIKKNFIAYGTSSFISNNFNLLTRLKNNGLSALIVGFEYINDFSLNTVGKNSSATDNLNTIKICKDLDIELFALFICDTSWHHQDFFNLARYVKENKITFATFSTPTVFPKTDFAIEQNSEFEIEKLWRYDLLRLHSKPKYISIFSYYIWLYILYLIPIMNITSFCRIISKFGVVKGVKTSFQSSFFGLIYFIKLLIWR